MRIELPSIRPATVKDVETIATLAARTFHDAFAADNVPSNMEMYLKEAFSIERTQSELMDTNNRFLLAFLEGANEPSGYTKLRMGTLDESVRGPNPIEIERLYVDQVVIGRGVGAALMQACLNEARELGYRTVWLGVWKKNQRAIAFYQRWGFRPVGTHVFTLGTEQQNDWIMQRSVDVPAQA